MAGVVVLLGMSLLEEDEVLRGLRSRIIRPVELREDPLVGYRHESVAAFSSVRAEPDL